MRVRTSADSIRNLERLLAFDEAAGSKSVWLNSPDAGADISAHAAASDDARDHKQSAESGASNRHSHIPTGQGRGGPAMINHY